MRWVSQESRAFHKTRNQLLATRKTNTKPGGGALRRSRGVCARAPRARAGKAGSGLLQCTWTPPPAHHHSGASGPAAHVPRVRSGVSGAVWSSSTTSSSGYRLVAVAVAAAAGADIGVQDGQCSMWWRGAAPGSTHAAAGHKGNTSHGGCMHASLAMSHRHAAYGSTKCNTGPSTVATSVANHVRRSQRDQQLHSAHTATSTHLRSR